MRKAGLIGAAIGFVLALAAAVITPLCNPCLVIVLGLAVGALTAYWDHPVTQGSSALEGAKAGAIAAVGALVGQMGGTLANGFLVGPEGVAEIYRELGTDIPITPEFYWISALGSNGLCALFNVALGAGLGALGGLLWYKLGGRDLTPATVPEDTV